MPYAPGVTDQSGQLLAGGINGILAQHAQDMLRMQENEQKRRAAAGQIQGLLASDPQLAQKADPTLVQKLGAGKATLADTMQLLGTLSAVKSSENEQLNAKLNQAKIDQLGRQNTMLQQQIAAMQAEQASRSRNTAAVGTAMNGPYVDQSPEAILRHAAQNGADVETLGKLSQMAENMAQARSRGQPQGMVFPNAQSLEAKYPAAQYDYQMTEDPRTGAVTVPKVSPRAPAQPPNQPNQFKGALDDALGKQVAGFIDRVPEYNNTIEEVQRARSGLAAGAYSGGFAEAKLALAQGVNGLLGTKVFDTAATELNKAAFASMALTAAQRMRNQGQITESERKILADTVAQLGNSPQAAEYVMNFMEATAQRNLAKAQALQALRDEGNGDAAPYSRILARFDRENPLNLPEIKAVPTTGGPTGKGGAAAPARGAGRFKIVEIR